MAARIFDAGGGPAVVVVPGVQGRWEWMSPMLEALGRRCRTISYSLCGEPGSGRPFDRAQGFDGFVRQLDDVIAGTGVDAVTVCGVSYGGFVALRYAARFPSRVRGLVLVSTPPPGWRPSPVQQRHLAHPVVSLPFFALGAAGRLWREVRWALPGWRAQVRFVAVQTVRVLRAPLVPTAAATRMAVQQATDFLPDCARIAVPALIVSGDDHLDRVVPPAATRQYLSLIPGARYEQLARTGHLGLLTRPERFVDLVSDFVHANHQ